MLEGHPMPEPLVSILIPSYNHGAFLNACLDSIRRQSFSDWEAVIVDDGSADDSVALARREAKADGRIRVFVNERNLGTYGTQRRALELAAGRLIAVLNSDDQWDSEKLSRQVELLNRHASAAMCYTLGWQIDDAGRSNEAEDVHADWPTDEVQEPLPYLLYENRILASSVVFRRDGLRFEPSCRYSGDWVALLERSFAGPAVCVPERLTFWRQHGSNTYRRSPKQVLEEVSVRKAIHEVGARWHRPRFEAATAGRISIGLAMNALNLQALAVLAGDTAFSREMAAAAARLAPHDPRVRKRRLLSMLPLGIQRRRLWKGEAIDLDPRAIESAPPVPLRLS